jgi:hypothetical protein
MEPASTFVVDKTISPRTYDAYVGRYFDLLSEGGLIVSKVGERLFARCVEQCRFRDFSNIRKGILQQDLGRTDHFCERRKGRSHQSNPSAMGARLARPEAS